MNNVFDFNRFVRLINRQWIGFGKIYLMSLGVMAGILFAFYGFKFYLAFNSESKDVIVGMLYFRLSPFILMHIAFISIVGSSYFSSLGNKSKAIFELLLPASQQEKFLAGLFYTIILPIISFILVFFLVDLAWVTYLRSYLSSLYPSDYKTLIFNGGLSYFFSSEIPRHIYLLSFIPFLLSAIFLLGSIAFKSFQFIKTAMLLVVYCFVFVITMVKLMNWITADSMLVEDGLMFDNEMNVLKLICVIGVVLTFIFWGIGYLRLKEKEV